MRLETTACNQCGAPLSVPEAAQFVRCNHCSASLAVRRSESVTYTEVVEKLVEHTSKLAEQVAHLRYQNELTRIDREWEAERLRHLVSRKDGPPQEPTKGAAAAAGLAMIVGGIIAIAVSLNNGAEPMAIFALILIGCGVYTIASGTQKADAFERARMRYLGRRGSLKIDDFRGDYDANSIANDDIPPRR